MISSEVESVSPADADCHLSCFLFLFCFRFLGNPILCLHRLLRSDHQASASGLFFQIPRVAVECSGQLQLLFSDEVYENIKLCFFMSIVRLLRFNLSLSAFKSSELGRTLPYSCKYSSVWVCGESQYQNWGWN